MSRLNGDPNDLRKFRKIASKLSRLIENADYDHGHEDMGQQSYSIGGDKGDFETTNKGRADIKSRRTAANYGDNPMKNDSEPKSKKIEISEDETGILDRLQSILEKAGITTDEINAGIDLTQKGMQKVAASLGISAHEIPMLLGSLTTRLRDQAAKDESAFESMYESYINEDDRFGYEKDSNGNVTVRDSQTGKEVYLQGSQATDLLTQLSQQPDDEQDILGGLEPLMEGIMDESEDYLDEMKQSSGTFNFPWTLGGKHGTGTARYSFSDGEMHLKILSVRDSAGHAISDPNMRTKLDQIARTFIENEDE